MQNCTINDLTELSVTAQLTFQHDNAVLMINQTNTLQRYLN